MLKLYDYWRSSAAYRVRIGLSLAALLAGCGLVDPSARDVDRAMSAYLASQPDAALATTLVGARAVDVGPCPMMATGRVCAVSFERADGAHVLAHVQLAERGMGWVATDAALVEGTP